MVINDFNIVWSILFPAKTDSPLRIDPDAMLTGSVSSHHLQPIAAQTCKIIKRRCHMKDEKAASGLISKLLEG